MGAWISNFSYCCDQTPNKKEVKGGNVCFGSQSKGAHHHGGKGMQKKQVWAVVADKTSETPHCLLSQWCQNQTGDQQ